MNIQMCELHGIGIHDICSVSTFLKKNHIKGINSQLK